MNNILDDLAFEIDIEEYYDPELRQLLSFNPYHNMHVMKDKVEELGRDYFFNPDREIIETDRSGWRGYGKIYSRFFSKLKNNHVNLLEIGIQTGYGCLAWRRYFKNANIFGIEKYGNDYTKCYTEMEQLFPVFFKQIKMYIDFDSLDKLKWELIFKDQKFDIIIDDGSHNPEDQRNTMLIGLDYLNKGGYYVIEDIKTCSVYSSSIPKHFKNYSNDYVQTNNLAIKLLAMYDNKEIKNLYFFKHINQERKTLNILRKQNNLEQINPFDYSVIFKKN